MIENIILKIDLKLKIERLLKSMQKQKIIYIKQESLEIDIGKQNL